MINGNGGTIDFVALDGYRVATQSINNKTEFKIIIPNKTISFLLKLNLTEEKVKIKCNDKQIQIETVEYTIISRLIQGEFIDYKKAIPEEFNQVEIEKKKILEIMGRALLLQDGKVKQVTKLIFEKDKMTILHETESSQYQDEIKIKSNIEMTIGVNPKYLFECFKNLNQEIVLVKISEELKPIIVETQNQLSIVLPVRIKAGQ
jgi:DNA polymerase-3 subunit beta